MRTPTKEQVDAAKAWTRGDTSPEQWSTLRAYSTSSPFNHVAEILAAEVERLEAELAKMTTWHESALSVACDMSQRAETAEARVAELESENTKLRVEVTNWLNTAFQRNVTVSALRLDIIGEKMKSAKLREALGKWHVMDLEGNYPDEGAFYEPTLHPIAKAALAGTEEAK